MSKAKTVILLAFLFTALGSADANAQAKSDVIIKELRDRLAKTEAVLSAAMKAEAVARKQAEQQRKLAEVAREQAEQERAQALEAMKEAQRQREIAESLRLLAEKKLAEALQQAEKAKAATLEAATRKQAEDARSTALKESDKPKAKTPAGKKPRRGRRHLRQQVAELAEQVAILNKQMKQMQAELNALRQHLQEGSPRKEPAGDAAFDKFRPSPKAKELIEDDSRQDQKARDVVPTKIPEKKVDHLTLKERRLQKERDLELEELRRKLDEVIRAAEAARRSELESRKKTHP